MTVQSLLEFILYCLLIGSLLGLVCGWFAGSVARVLQSSRVAHPSHDIDGCRGPM